MRRSAVSGMGIPAFDLYIGIDYSGAQTPTSSLKGLRVYIADRTSPPVEVRTARNLLNSCRHIRPYREGTARTLPRRGQFLLRGIILPSPFQRRSSHCRII